MAETVVSETAPPGIRHAQFEVGIGPSSGGEQHRAPVADPLGQLARELRVHLTRPPETVIAWLDTGRHDHDYAASRNSHAIHAALITLS